ncbi:farnesol dehydrogenase-like [Condylostylus longicornis]|uniref:farnesol dehydrogenase-like n=1 Tax=Condylostylus longicornis TaxID=2530218 RepID=UPI00244DCA10|nr:farnesol dehydrogenase-like [Condylostylus longicornis]
MKRWENKLAVVTGASSGIGGQIIQDLAKCKIRVVALSRRLENMEDIRINLPEELRIYLIPIKCDITNEPEVQKIFDFIGRRHGGIDILINCAGAFREGNLLSLEAKLVRETIDTNLMSVVYCTREAFKSMQARNNVGHVILMNCSCGQQVPNISKKSLNIYCPTKFALTAINNIYKQEFQHLGTRVKITNISPGPMNTTLMPAEYSKENSLMLKPEDVSNAVFFALSTPPKVQITNLVVTAFKTTESTE